MKNNYLKKSGYKSAAVVFMTMVLLLGMIMAMNPLKARADESVEIWTYEDLLKIADNPSGAYLLMADIDLEGKTWNPLDFSGTFDGGGHAVLNADIHSVGEKTFSTYDGNMVEYDTQFSGFFSSLVNAEVRNLKLLGQKVDVETSVPVFAGSIAGYMENSSISNCVVYGDVAIHTNGKSFGTGGIAGFGNGSIENVNADVTLVCIDKDVEDKDEQFMGGAYAAGYNDLKGNTIRIDGYDSDHGYVHDGGLVGMYILYPADNGYAGYILGNTVDGQITFFEDNEDRRAYCEAYIGEIMNWNFAYDDGFDSSTFYRNEIFEYGTDLYPHMCDNPQITETSVDATETVNGYTNSACNTCGYSRWTKFTPVIGNDVLVAAHTGISDDPEDEGNGNSGQQDGNDSEVADGQPVGENASGKSSSGGNLGLFIVIIVLVVIIAAVIIIWIRIRNKQKRQAAIRSKNRRRGQDNLRNSSDSQLHRSSQSQVRRGSSAQQSENQNQARRGSSPQQRENQSQARRGSLPQQRENEGQVRRWSSAQQSETQSQARRGSYNPQRDNQQGRRQSQNNEAQIRKRP